MTYTSYQGELADEAAVLTKLAAMAATAGMSTGTFTSGASGTPTVRYFKSDGEDGLSRIVGGIASVGTRQFQGFCGVDMDDASTPLDGGVMYTNDDSTAASTRVEMPGSSTSWPSRDAGTVYLADISMSKDGCGMLCEYISGGVVAQAFFGFGKTIPQSREITKQAKAKLASITSGSNANQRLFTLDRSILSMLKDNNNFADDPHQLQLFAQPLVETGGSGQDPDELFMVERLPVVSGTLADSSGVTTFEVDVTALVKLGTQYAANNVNDDLIRLHAEPTWMMCGGSTTRAAVFPYNATNTTQLCAWDARGGQDAAMNFVPFNYRAGGAAGTREQYADPDPSSGLMLPFESYLITVDTATGLVAQPNREGQKNCGVMTHLLWLPNPGSPTPQSHNLFQVDENAAKRYAYLEKFASNGMAPPALMASYDVLWAVGPMI